MARVYIIKLFILAMLVIAGIVLEIAGPLDAEKMLYVAAQYTDHGWLTPVLILLQAVLFAIALAGSFFLCIAAPLIRLP